MKKDIQNIAIVRLSALGDIVNSAFVLQFIKAAYPHAKISWIVEESFSDILSSAKYLDTITSINLKALKHDKSFARLKSEIAKLKTDTEYDIVIDMQGLIKSAVVARLLGKKTHGFDKNSTREGVAALLYRTKTAIPYEENVILRNAKVVSDALGIAITEDIIQNKEAVFEATKEFLLQKEKANVAFVIGASWPSKIYPKEQIAQVCAALDVEAHIIWGNEAELREAEWIVANTQNATLAPKCNLRELVSFISHMDLLIGNDTGPTHIAWAQNIPSITLLGPTTERMIGKTSQNVGVKSPSKVNLLKIDKNDYSIKDIKPQNIIKKAKELLHGV